MSRPARKGAAALAVALAVVYCAQPGFAQIVVSGSSGQVVQSGSAYTYLQNFDSLGSTSGSWVNNSTLPGWYAVRQTAPTTISSYTADNGSLNTGGLYSYGSTAAADRALGTTRTNHTGNMAYGVVFHNQTSAPLNVTIAFTGEHWSNGGNQPQILDFTYLVSSSPVSNFDPSSEIAGGFVPFNDLDFAVPNRRAGQFALDGNVSSNRVSLASTLPVTLNPGDFMALRWFDLNSPGRDHGIAIDDLAVTFTPVPEPGAVLAVAVGVMGLAGLSRRARRRVGSCRPSP
jgi:hypothetical protein